MTLVSDCGELETPNFGSVNHDPGTVYKFVAAYTCEKGYELIGSNIRRCQADGNWSSSTPICQPYGLYERMCMYIEMFQ